MKKILVIAAHPDDEVLGCGGTIAKHIHNKDSVQVHILAEGITSRKQDNQQHELSHLHQSAIKANKILGVDDLHLHNFPDNTMDSITRLVVTQHIEKIIQNFQPHIIYTHHAGDVNIDHRRIHEAVVTATRPMPNGLRPTVLFFEIMSSTEWQTPYSAPAFLPNWYHNISDFLAQKCEALNAYSSEMREWPHARSVKALEHLAHWRGSNVGCHAAEAFMLGRYYLD